MLPASRPPAYLRHLFHASRCLASQSTFLQRRPASNVASRLRLPTRSQIQAAKPQTEEKEDKTSQRQRPEEHRKSIFDSISLSPTARRWLWRIFFIAPPIAVFCLQAPLTLMHVHGPSMSPFLNVNSSPDLPQTSDTILVQKVLFADSPLMGIRTPKWDLQRGQIAVFYAPHDPTRLAVKRVIGLPGDRVRPLPGYPGGDEPVVVPYNHVWVEGDANSREKSVDSNWYGPISQNLIIGFVLMVLTPWYMPAPVRWSQHDYPAKNSGRVEKDVVHDAKLDPDDRDRADAFNNGAAARELAAITKNRDQLPWVMRDPDKLSKLRMMYSQAKDEVDRQDPETRDVAMGLVVELELAFEAVGLSKDGNLLPPAMRDLAYNPGQEHESDKQKRLREYLDRQPQDSKQVRSDTPQLSRFDVG